MSLRLVGGSVLLLPAQLGGSFAREAHQSRFDDVVLRHVDESVEKSVATCEHLHYVSNRVDQTPAPRHVRSLRQHVQLYCSPVSGTNKRALQSIQSFFCCFYISEMRPLRI